MARLDSNLFILILIFIHFSRRNILSGFLIQGGEYFSNLRYSAEGVNIFKTFPFFAENDSEVTGMAVLCQKAVLV